MAGHPADSHQKCRGAWCADHDFVGWDYGELLNMAKTPFFLRKAQSDLIKAQDADRRAVLGFRLLGTKMKFLIEDIWNWFSAPRVISVLILIGGMLGLALDWAYKRGHLNKLPLSLEDNVLIALSPEYVGIAISVLIIDWANARVQKQQHKQELISRLMSESVSISSDALAELSASGWLYDGTLEREDLTEANLPDAKMVTSFIFEPQVGFFVRLPLPAKLKSAVLRFACLRGGNLEEADLSKTDLFGADLRGASLKMTNLKAANLRSADCTGMDLRGAALGGSNLADANLKDVIISEPFPVCDGKTILPDRNYWSSNDDFYRFVDQSREDFWKAPPCLRADALRSDYLGEI